MTAKFFEVTSDDLTDIYSAFHQPDGIYSMGDGTDQIGWYWQSDDDPIGPFDTEAAAIADAQDSD